jgi:hypothetical protein
MMMGGRGAVGMGVVGGVCLKNVTRFKIKISVEWSWQLTFQPSRTYAQYDLAALVSVPDIDKTMTNALTLVDKSMHSNVASRKLATIRSEHGKHFLYRWVDSRWCSWIRGAQQKLWDMASTGEII